MRTIDRNTKYRDVGGCDTFGDFDPGTRLRTAYFVFAPQSGVMGAIWRAKLEGEAEPVPFLCLSKEAVSLTLIRLRGEPNGRRAEVRSVDVIVSAESAAEKWAVPLTRGVAVGVRHPDSLTDDGKSVRIVEEAKELEALMNLQRISFPEFVMM